MRWSRPRIAAPAVIAFLACRSDPLAPGPQGPNRRPLADLRGPSFAREGATVTFSARGSRDPDGGPLNFTWFTGDGRTISDTGGTGRDPNSYRDGAIDETWTYGDNGTYTVSVIVRDAAGAADTASTTVTVQNAPPTILLVQPPRYQAVGDAATTRVAFSDSGSADANSITIHWGDGTSDTASVSANTSSHGILHTYGTTGSYWIQATIRDKDGASASLRADSALRVFDPTGRQNIAGYDIFDLGTLGGNSARPADVNDYGQVVGMSVTPSGDRHAFLWENGVLRDLGTLGHRESQAQRINNAGVIAGSVWTGTMSDYGNTIAAVWRNGSGTILDHHIYSAMAINESNEVVWNTAGHETGTGSAWRDGSWQSLGRSSWAAAINERGQIVGASAAAVSSEHSPPSDYHAFIWDDGAKRDLGLLSPGPCGPNRPDECGQASAFAINERGQIVGYSTAADGSLHAVLWENGTVRDLGIVKNEGPGPLHFVINDRGQVAGSSGGEGFFWSNGTLLTLASLGGGETHVVDMNEAGTVVGTSRTANGEQHAFAWSREGGMVDLGSGPHGFGAAWVVGVSFRGDIVGFTAPPCTEGPGVFCWPPGGNEVRAVMWRRLTPQAAARE